MDASRDIAYWFRWQWDPYRMCVRWLNIAARYHEIDPFMGKTYANEAI